MTKIVKYVVTLVVGIVLFLGCGSNEESKEKVAMDKIIYFAENAEPIPTVEDYELAGVVGVTELLLLEINQVISNLSKEEVDTKEEIQALITALGEEIVVPASRPVPKPTPTPVPEPVLEVIPEVIPDTTLPIITLIGSEIVTIAKGTSYTDAGATAKDDVDGDITDKIVLGGDTVNTNARGTYIITYTVKDKAGNETLPRTIRVVTVQ